MTTQESDPPRPWVVLKFGGTSVSSLANWRTIAETVRENLSAGKRVLVVCSALSQVSNRLEALLAAAAENRDLEDDLAELARAHQRLAEEMGLDYEALVGQLLSDIGDVLEGIRLTREITPRLRARVLSAGERLSTRLGATWLESQGIPVSWQDARELLEARAEPRASAERQYLSATCDHAPDPELDAKLRVLAEPAVLTQGFVATLPDGDTVLLGRGGSDTAAAYFAAKLSAERMEIWTDVPGLYSANPRDVPQARLLSRIGYAEAEELASKGAKVLHPRCIRPAADSRIPIHIRCTPDPEQAGTIISNTADNGPGVRAVSKRKGLLLVSMHVDADRGEVGTIADLTGCFKEHSLSIDLIASSPTNLTVAIDPRINPLDEEILDGLLTELHEHCIPQLIRPTASVSLVGTGIRDILHEWAGVLEVFEDEPVYLVSQAANDLSLTLVVNESSADHLERELHDRLFPVAAPAGAGV